jgi:hypothetical protein
MATQQNCALPLVFCSTTTGSNDSSRWAASRSSIWPTIRTARRSPSRNTCPTPGPARRGRVTPHVTEAHQGAFRYGMKCFFEEGRALAKLVHPNVVRVLNFFRANGTVYMVMQFERAGRSTTTSRRTRATSASASSAACSPACSTACASPRPQAAAPRHQAVEHLPAGRRHPVLLDFGAARQTLMSDTPILKPMHPRLRLARAVQPRRPRPVERHLQRGRQHVCLPGRQLAPALRRAHQARHRRPRKAWAGQYSPIFWPPSTGACNPTR